MSAAALLVGATGKAAEGSMGAFVLALILALVAAIGIGGAIFSRSRAQRRAAADRAAARTPLDPPPDD